MPTRSTASLLRVASALALVLVLAGCSKGGQFDPTELFSSDDFDSKKKLKGDREPVFPSGVPGATTGVPAELVKGYQPPPEQTAASAAPPPTAQKPKPKPKPKLATATAPAPARTRINVGSTPTSAAPTAASSPSVWPSPPQATSAQTAWPTPAQTAPAQQAAQPAGSVWPNPPAPGKFSQ
jgi:outer membrane biosynthesis protein TonB